MAGLLEDRLAWDLIVYGAGHELEKRRGNQERRLGANRCFSFGFWLERAIMRHS